MTLFFDKSRDWQAAILHGTKVHTVRSGRRIPKPGAVLSLVRGRFTGRHTFARNGGFTSRAEMLAYYGEADGHVIHWANLRYHDARVLER